MGKLGESARKKHICLEEGAFDNRGVSEVLDFELGWG